MNVVPVRVLKDEYILAIFDNKDGLVEIVVQGNTNIPVRYKGYGEALAQARYAHGLDSIVNVSEPMARAEYDSRLAKYKATLLDRMLAR